MSSSIYSHIPTEEKDDVLEVVVSNERRNTRRPMIIIVSAFALVLVALGILVGLFNHGEPKITGHPEIPIDFPGKLFHEDVRATSGDLYLLGVGKADITGYVE